jgi:radical SAM/Cys-rich protein
MPAVDVFAETLVRRGLPRLTRGRITTLQVNVGKRCNMACHHCHVEAGPKRTEIMPRNVALEVVRVLERSPSVELVDLTGGAPELNPSFRFLVESATALGRRVIDRCNLTVLFEPGQQDTAEFLAGHRVQVVASLPCYQQSNVEEQRGKGAFDASIRALQLLNALGYGRPGSGLVLDLVYNPVGASLPPPQANLELRYKQELGSRFGIEFNRLLTLTNMPIRRFAHFLERTGQTQPYMSLLVNHFNPATVPELMCRALVSVGWNGLLYDCDFNQMLEIPLGNEPATGARTIFELADVGQLEGSAVATERHCFGCSAGAGSSCSGALS